MSCQTVRKSISDFLDQRLAEEEKESIRQHLAFCRQCALQFDQMLHLRALLRQTPMRPVPPRLVSQLQVLASHERGRRLATGSLAAVARHMFTSVSLFADNLMRPFAVPAAGGLVAALLLFMVLVPRLSFSHNLRNDVPTAVGYVEATVDESSPFYFLDDETEVELTIDKNGQVTDFAVPKGRITRDVVANLGNSLLFTSFSPATMFGQPVSGKIRVSFRKQHIVVPG